MKTNHLKRMIVVSLISIGSIACTQTVYLPIELSRPARPVLPAITDAEAQHIPQATWNKMVTRSRLRRQYAEQLEVIIDSTKAVAQ